MNSAQTRQFLALGLNIANRAVIADIESECVAVDLGDGHRWYDTRPMLDEREHAPDVIEMATQALQWAAESALVQRHAEQPHLLRIVPLPHEG